MQIWFLFFQKHHLKWVPVRYCARAVSKLSDHKRSCSRVFQIPSVMAWRTSFESWCSVPQTITLCVIDWTTVCWCVSFIACTSPMQLALLELMSLDDNFTIILAKHVLFLWSRPSLRIRTELHYCTIPFFNSSHRPHNRHTLSKAEKSLVDKSHICDSLYREGQNISVQLSATSRDYQYDGLKLCVVLVSISSD